MCAFAYNLKYSICCVPTFKSFIKMYSSERAVKKQPCAFEKSLRCVLWHERNMTLHFFVWRNCHSREDNEYEPNVLTRVWRRGMEKYGVGTWQGNRGTIHYCQVVFCFTLYILLQVFHEFLSDFTRSLQFFY